jgi:RNA polymerase sigma factor (TIGR02999 family)
MMKSFRNWLRNRMDLQPGDSSDVTRLLRQWREPQARERLFSIIYPELKRVARMRMSRERADHTLQPTALVNEVFLSLVRHDAVNWQNRAHFLAIASTAMRRILVDHAREHSAQKRGAGQTRLAEDPSDFAVGADFAELVELDDLLEKLSRKHARVAQVVELRYFGGLSCDEVAEILKVNPRTVKRDWEIARAWLFAALRPEE